MPYKSLDAEKIDASVVILAQRIEERFPGAGLGKVAQELHGLCAKAVQVAEVLRRPIIPLRIGIGLLTLLIIAGAGVAIYVATLPEEPITFPEVVQLLESGINDIVFIGIAVFFLASLERRLKRHRALAAIHELRSIAHVVDMHQLTKDPGRQVHVIGDTPSSPRRTLSPPELARYLDYCSELLSLTGKVAALYVERFDDSDVLSAVDEVEGLTTALSGKIWQKLVVIETAFGEGRGQRPAVAPNGLPPRPTSTP